MNRTAIIPVLMAVGLTVGVYFVSERPARHRFQDLKAELAAEEARTEEYCRDLTKLEKLIAQHKANTAYAGAGQTGLVALDRISTLYRLLDSLSRQDGIRVEEITPSIEETVQYFMGEGDGSGNRTVPIQMSVRGRYRNLADLAEAVEKNPFWDHLLCLRVMGGPELSPDCRMTISFAADLDRQRETASSE